MPPDASTRAPGASALRRLKLRQLELLVRLSEHASLARAAAAMNVTQPAATKLLHETERTLGASLFDRLPRGMRPTACGEIMMRHARTVLAALERGREEVASYLEAGTGSVAVGSMRGATASLLAPALAAVRDTRPRVRMTVLVDAAEILIPRLREARLDIVLGNIPASLAGPDLAFEPLLEESLAVVCGPHHPFARRRRLRWADAAGSEWIVYPQEAALRPFFEGVLSRAAQAPAAIETASVVATTMLLERTRMLAVMPRDVAGHYERRRMVAILPLRFPATLGEIGIVRHAERELSPAAAAFVAEVRRLASARGRRRPRVPRAGLGSG